MCCASLDPHLFLACPPSQPAKLLAPLHSCLKTELRVGGGWGRKQRLEHAALEIDLLVSVQRSLLLLIFHSCEGGILAVENSSGCTPLCDPPCTPLCASMRTLGTSRCSMRLLLNTHMYVPHSGRVNFPYATASHIQRFGLDSNIYGYGCPKQLKMCTI